MCDRLCALRQGVVKACESCSQRLSSESHRPVQHPLSDLCEEDPVRARDARIRELELELARTKLAQVEVECKNQVSDWDAVKGDRERRSKSDIGRNVARKGWTRLLSRCWVTLVRSS